MGCPSLRRGAEVHIDADVWKYGARQVAEQFREQRVVRIELPGARRMGATDLVSRAADEQFVSDGLHVEHQVHRGIGKLRPVEKAAVGVEKALLVRSS